MKVTVENDKGKRKEFECDGLALVAQNGKKTKSFVEGKCDSVQWAYICVALDETKRKIADTNPLIETAVRLYGMDLDGIIARMGKDDKS